MTETGNENGKKDPVKNENGTVNSPLVFFIKQEITDKLNPGQSVTENASQIIQTMDEIQYLIGMRQYKTGRDKAIGEKLAPFKDSIQKLEMAYLIVAYPLLEETRYRTVISEYVRDAQEHPGKDIEEYPHRAPFALNDEEHIILGQLTRKADIAIDPQKRVYDFIELVPWLDARHEATMASPVVQRIKQNMIEEGIIKKNSDIDDEIRRRRIKLVPPHTEPSDSKE